MEKSQTFHEHLNELKNRALWVFLAIVISTALGYIFRNSLINFLDRPLGKPLYYTSPAGSFNFVVKVAGIFGVFITFPVLVYQIIRFIEPAINQKIKGSKLIKVMLAAMFLALLGATFAFYIIIPTSLHFFNGYQTSTIKPLISANDYLNYVTNAILCFALFFQLPLLIDFIDYITPIKPSKLLKYQKQVIIGALVIAILLPFTYDPISQFVVAIPIIVLYYISVVMLYIKNKKAIRRYTYSDNKFLGELPFDHNLNINEIGIDELEEIKPNKYQTPILLKNFVPINLKENPRMHLDANTEIHNQKIKRSIDGVIVSKQTSIDNIPRSKRVMIYG